MRSVQDRFWSDGWVRKLNPLDRYLFLYLLTNEHTNWAGVYELDMGMMAFETGIDERELERSMLPRLAPKVIYLEGWVYVPNWVKHHHSESGTISPQQKEGIRKAMERVPAKIRSKLKEIQNEEIPYPYPMDTLSPSSLSLSSSLVRANALPIITEFVVSPDLDGESGDSKSPRVSGEKKKAYDELIAWSENERGFKFPKTTITKQYRAFKLANENGIPRERLMEMWEEMASEKFWQKAGFDWMNVLQECLKKPV